MRLRRWFNIHEADRSADTGRAASDQSVTVAFATFARENLDALHSSIPEINSRRKTFLIDYFHQSIKLVTSIARVIVRHVYPRFTATLFFLLQNTSISSNNAKWVGNKQSSVTEGGKRKALQNTKIRTYTSVRLNLRFCKKKKPRLQATLPAQYVYHAYTTTIEQKKKHNISPKYTHRRNLLQKFSFLSLISTKEFVRSLFSP